ncbi:MAG: alpha/beta fold hydrolase [Myxococcales bacterium]|nr:alpha/beta fold hydrolase [Myxococcales bacterium]
MPPQTPAPGVVMLHGSEGGTEPFLPEFAAELSKQGFVVVTLCWFGCQGTPDRVLRVPLDRVTEVGNWLSEAPEVRGGVGLFGWSRGGEAAVLVTSLLADTKPYRAVAVHAPSDTIVASFDPKTQDSVFETSAQTGRTVPAPAWTWKGQDLFGEPTTDFRTPGPRIVVEKYPGPVYVSAGERDEIWEVGRSRRIVSARATVPSLVTQSHFWPGEGHVLSTASAAKQHAEIATFFKTHLAL